VIQARVIPCLLLKHGGLVKTVRFKSPRYIGDPINAVRIFNEKEVDELVFLDTTATLENREPDYELLSEIAKECFMPFSYGGGIRGIDTIHRLLRIGVEKVVLNSIAAEQPSVVRDAAKRFGSSTIIGAFDLKKGFWGGYRRCIRGGRSCVKVSPIEYAQELEALGVGEIFVNSIDRDGLMSGYDLETLGQISSRVGVPVIACGGAGGLEDIAKLLRTTKVSAAAAGSMFVYQGDLKGILINYPSRADLDRVIAPGE
jgi:cyclase